MSRPRSRPRAPSSLRRGPLLLLLLGLGSALPLRGQTVRGTVVEMGTGAPVEGALVALIGADGRARARVLTDAGGRFALPAPGPGTYTVRADRIGHAGVESPPFRLGEGEGLEVRLMAPVEAIRLEGLRVEGEPRCRVRPGEGLATARAWGEVWKALEAAE